MNEKGELVQINTQQIKERAMLVAHIGQLAGGETFGPQSFVDYLETMQKIVGTGPKGASCHFPYDLDRGVGTNGYLEFYPHDKALCVTREEVEEKNKHRQREMAVQLLESGDFGVRMVLPIDSFDITYLRWLLPLDELVSFTVDSRLKSGKGGSLYAVTPLPEATIKHLCTDILHRLMKLPADYVFLDVS